MTAAIPRRSKYGSKIVTYDGVKYHSAAEARRAMELDILIKCKKIQRWERQIPFAIEINGVHVCRVVVDFRVYPLAGMWWLEEVKGHETPVYKLKRKLFAACYPNLDYRVLNV